MKVPPFSAQREPQDSLIIMNYDENKVVDSPVCSEIMCEHREGFIPDTSEWIDNGGSFQLSQVAILDTSKFALCVDTIFSFSLVEDLESYSV